MINPATTQNANETLQLGEALGAKLIPGDLVLLFGDLGVGKTCLTQGICLGAGLENNAYIRSPTFTLINEYKGKVPDDLEKLVGLPGVGRKTANCVLVYAYEKPAIPVDIHVHRISNRLGLVKTKNPEETEFELMKIIPKKLWLDINETFVKYGQNICKPISPMCKVCQIKNSCNYYKTKNASL